jgi:peptidoglycan/xylan/chitin deacetylase (PgdA/CDA1 family)
MKQILKRAATRSLMELWSLSHRRCDPGLRILLYHAVGTPLDGNVPGLTISPELFRVHMAELRRMQEISIVPLEEPLFPEAERGKTRVAVTFDDGYLDNLEVAAPILADLKIPFTVFVVPGYAKSGNPIYLTFSQLRELASVPGCRIGSHGMTHLRLAQVDGGAAIRELADSRKWLEDSLGKPVVSVSYPYGSTSGLVRIAAVKVGYKIGACSRTGINGPDRDPLMLCRTEILGIDGPRAFRQKVRGGWDWHRFRHPDPASG